MSFFEENCPEMDRYLENHASAEPDILRRFLRTKFAKPFPTDAQALPEAEQPKHYKFLFP